MAMPMYGQPMGYNPWSGGYQPQQQAFMPNVNSFMPKQQNVAESIAGTSPWAFVSSEEDARNRIVQPGQTAWFMDNNNPRFYVKACDISGAVTFKRFTFQEDAGEPVKAVSLDADGVRKIVDERLNELLNLKGDMRNESTGFDVRTDGRAINTKSAK
nr:MAG TPA: hypothetical protein [Bacteriophage sp.]